MRRVRLLALLLALSITSTSAALTGGGTSDTPVTITADAATFSVTVPTTIPIYVSADGTVTTSNNFKLINNSCADVLVSNLYVSVSDPWQLVDFSEDFSTKPVGSKYLALQFGPCDVYVDGTTNLASSTIRANGFKLMPLTAKVTPQREASSNLDIAKVIFTVGWYDAYADETINVWTLAGAHPHVVCRNDNMIEVSGYNDGFGAFHYSCRNVTEVAEVLRDFGLPSFDSSDTYVGYVEFEVLSRDIRWIQFYAGGWALKFVFDDMGGTSVEYSEGKPFALSASTRHMLGYTADQEYIVIPKSFTYGGTRYTVTDIYPDAFKDCTALKYVSLPSSVSYIAHSKGSYDPETHTRNGNYLFDYSPNLVCIEFKGCVYSSREDFYNNAEAYIPVCYYDYTSRKWLNGGCDGPGLGEPMNGYDLDVDWGSMVGP